MRIGHGFDVHRLTPGRRLVIGGVVIPYDRGLLGHSDADVLLHAIADALLGAAGLPDIGQQFPPTDERFKDADSRRLLEIVVGLVRAAGLPVIHNVDAIIMAEHPRMNPYIAAMRVEIAAILGISVEQVGLKATTTETLGFVGREEGIAASAVCLIDSHE
jgi:2-C-methyl-D-erythritol 2,4-cyclodiphosphate synthase